MIAQLESNLGNDKITSTLIGHGWFWHFRTGLALYCLSSAIVILGVFFGNQYVRPLPLPNAVAGAIPDGDFIDAFATWDGRFYKKIVLEGYTWNPNSQSVVVFFPAYPLLARSIMYVTGWPAEVALLVVSHLSFLLALTVFSAYLERRTLCFVAGRHYAMLALGVFPTTFFFRVAYSESLFLLTVALVLYGMDQQWPAWRIAFVIGFATGTRSVGVGLLIPYAFYLYQRGLNGWKMQLRYFWLVLACWGLGGFMIFQWIKFGDPFAFLKNQYTWELRHATNMYAKAFDLITLDPVISVFTPSSPCFWCRWDGESNPAFSLFLANPFYWTLASLLIFIGWSRHWLSNHETILSVVLLMIPYILKAHEGCMWSMGRFSIIVLPEYIVIGRLFACVQNEFALGIFCTLGFLLGIYAAMFAAGYQFI